MGKTKRIQILSRTFQPLPPHKSHAFPHPPSLTVEETRVPGRAGGGLRFPPQKPEFTPGPSQGVPKSQLKIYRYRYF